MILQQLEPSLLGGPLGWFGRLKLKAQGMESGAYAEPVHFFQLNSLPERPSEEDLPRG